MSKTTPIIVPTADFTSTASYTDSRDGAAAGKYPLVVREEVTVASATQDTTMDASLPAGFVLEAIVIKAKQDATFATANSLSIGDGTTADLFFETAMANVDTKNDQLHVVLSAPYLCTAALTPHVESTNGSGGGAGTVIGAWAIEFIGYVLPSIGQYA